MFRRQITTGSLSQVLIRGRAVSGRGAEPDDVTAPPLCRVSSVDTVARVVHRQHDPGQEEPLLLLPVSAERAGKTATHSHVVVKRGRVEMAGNTGRMIGR